MRTFLHTLAAVQVVTASALVLATATAAGVAFVLPISDNRFSVVALLVVTAVFAFLVIVSGILWCVTDLTAPLTPPVSPGKRRPMRQVLRVLAQVQMGIGMLVIAPAAVYASDRLLVRPGLPVGDALTALVALHAAVGLSCLGGILWCAVHVAYPDGAEAAALSNRQAEANPPDGQKNRHNR